MYHYKYVYFAISILVIKELIETYGTKEDKEDTNR